MFCVWWMELVPIERPGSLPWNSKTPSHILGLLMSSFCGRLNYTIVIPGRMPVVAVQIRSNCSSWQTAHSVYSSESWLSLITFSSEFYTCTAACWNSIYFFLGFIIPDSSWSIFCPICCVHWGVNSIRRFLYKLFVMILWFLNLFLLNHHECTMWCIHRSPVAFEHGPL